MDKKKRNISDEERLNEYFKSQNDDFYADIYTLGEKKKDYEDNIKKEKDSKNIYEYEKDEEEHNIEQKGSVDVGKKSKKIFAIFISVFIILAAFMGHYMINAQGNEEKIANYLDVMFIKDENKTFEKSLYNKSNEEISGFDDDLKQVREDFKEKVIGNESGYVLNETNVNIMLLNTLKNVDYKINSVDVITTNAMINITLYMPDFEDVFIISINEAVNDSENENLSDSELMNKIIENYNKITVSDIKNTQEITFNLTFKKEEGIWHLSDTYNLSNKLFTKVSLGLQNGYVMYMNSF